MMNAEINNPSVIINESIPGYKNAEQLRLLGSLVQSLPVSSNIAEIGSCAGRGTWAISKNAPASSQVYAIDWWQGKTVFYGRGFHLDVTAEDTQAYFEKHVADCDNITPLRGDACEVEFTQPLDCLVIDCDYGKNKNNHYPIWDKWKTHLKSGALVIGANYYDHRPDEVEFAHFVRSQTHGFDFKHGIWWAFKKDVDLT